jgi:predicted TIM-barrel fold metal-dependent hydrolase
MPTSRPTELPELREQQPVLGVVHSAVEATVPRGACDCHVHVFGPAGRYALAQDRVFMPSPATVDDLVALQSALGLDRVVVVQASPQGTDNRCLVDALDELRERRRAARGVAVVDQDVDDAQLQALHRAGVRGLRVNLQSYGVADPGVAARQLAANARIAQAMGWHVQVYTSLPVIEALADTIARLDVPVVVDHFGLAHAADGTRQPGFGTLVQLVRDGRVYVKLSAPYRIATQPRGADGTAIARSLIEANLERMLWGTDWPHTHPPADGIRLRDRPEPFLPVDDGAQMNIFVGWTSAEERQRILVDNPASLYAFEACRTPVSSTVLMD